ncbi:MAG: hypothetical protein ACW99H_07710, partial [Candidatus Thorarchaeota archaeon]
IESPIKISVNAIQLNVIDSIYSQVIRGYSLEITFLRLIANEDTIVISESLFMTVQEHAIDTLTLSQRRVKG